MKRLFTWLTLGLLMSLAACNDVEDVDPALLQGQFTGTFERMVDGQSLGVASIGLLLEGNSFSGTGGPNRYPAICNGTFTVSENRIIFENACFFTADFDWSLFLNGSWQVNQQGGELILRRSADTLVDVYRLQRIVNDR
ncbi:hypothetical protein [Mongoliitalea daihaiensis]|uniref:hypothetical protein n=1 Tax=Mongoliitalea daihaiensis TaxID=2782006 RepID=UPI001F273D4F|nr:hypothetical protein [Mongoliitalea daihaiensis]UJP66706.1 hypothetical protein IPZ59_09020 [Mongoliitalea daihaiensis]